METYYKKMMQFKKTPLKKLNNMNILYCKELIDMLKRKIEQSLINWKNTKEHKPLIIKGCRQCGKTFSVLEL